MKKSFTYYLASLLLLSMFMGGCTSKEVTKSGSIVYPDSDSKILFYRDADTTGKPVTIRVEKRIVGVLKPKEYLSVPVCIGKHTIKISTRGADNAMHDKSASVVVDNNTSKYIYIDTSKAIAVPKAVSVASDDMITSGRTEGGYVVNRYVPTCTRYIDLSSDVLFAFGEAKLTPKGEALLSELVTTLKTKAIGIKKLVIEGHTDVIGGTAYNNNLSQRRAQAVVNFFKKQGLKIPMVAVGMGEKYPITKGCEKVSPRAKMIECLKPDRRVRIELINKTQLMQK
ncbi:MAG: OmpA family protein [Sulfurovaceae bacterium]